MGSERVVITGIGTVNAAGIGKEQFWDTVTAGRSAISSISRFDPVDHPVKVAG